MSDEVPTPEVPMSQDPSALSILQEQIKNLTTQVTELRELNTEAYKSLEERDARISTLEAKPESTARIAELEASIRDRNHFDKFAELAGAAKAKAKALRQLWRDAKDRGYEADGDEADEKALQAIVAKLKTEVDYAFDVDVDGTTTAAREAARPTSRTKYGLEMRGEEPAGGGRQERNKGADGTIVTQEMRADPKFMLDPKNREMIRDAALGGRFRNRASNPRMTIAYHNGANFRFPGITGILEAAQLLHSVGLRKDAPSTSFDSFQEGPFQWHDRSATPTPRPCPLHALTAATTIPITSPITPRHARIGPARTCSTVMPRSAAPMTAATKTRSTTAPDQKSCLVV